jgi:hypothetical protein
LKFDQSMYKTTAQYVNWNATYSDTDELDGR